MGCSVAVWRYNMINIGVCFLLFQPDKNMQVEKQLKYIWVSITDSLTGFSNICLK